MRKIFLFLRLFSRKSFLFWKCSRCRCVSFKWFEFVFNSSALSNKNTSTICNQMFSIKLLQLSAKWIAKHENYAKKIFFSFTTTTLLVLSASFSFARTFLVFIVEDECRARVKCQHNVKEFSILTEHFHLEPSHVELNRRFGSPFTYFPLLPCLSSWFSFVLQFIYVHFSFTEAGTRKDINLHSIVGRDRLDNSWLSIVLFYGEWNLIENGLLPLKRVGNRYNNEAFTMSEFMMLEGLHKASFSLFNKSIITHCVQLVSCPMSFI